MRGPRVAQSGRRALLAALALSLPFAVPAQAGSPAPAPCPGADAQVVDAASLKRATSGLRCLVNRVRAAAGRRPLRSSPVLDAVALRHARHAQRSKTVGHEDAAGHTLAERLRAAGYPRTANFRASETVSWGRGRDARPSALVAALRTDAAKRNRLQSADFRDLGIGLKTGLPVRRRGSGLTLTLIVGRR
jgi:uncharacterized protein YkwD